MKQSQAPFIKAWIDGKKVQYKEQRGTKWKNLLPYQNSVRINIKDTDEFRFAPTVWYGLYIEDVTGTIRSLILTTEERAHYAAPLNFISDWMKVDEYDSRKVEEARAKNPTAKSDRSSDSQ